ncbi:UNVERIFIED_CONTAM: Galactinol--sucrose galactosyltransferase [Sesamum angustifolium]|uniref:Galactinol--sucrose galactosyltransferase n=1 Tax=Sesamum angustifolium TaxID=2727405 RepID=A0AAW2LHA7_9LAMI
MAPSLSKNEAGFSDGVAHDGKPSSITLEASQFLANGHPILTQVPTNIIATPSPFISKDLTNNVVGCFLGFDADEPRSRHVVPIGKLRDIRFMSIFRFKVWWTTHWIGNSGKDVENETQMMILDKSDFGRPYVLLLPLIEGPFRASLQSGLDDDLDICVESGPPKSRAQNIGVFVHARWGRPISIGEGFHASH